MRLCSVLFSLLFAASCAPIQMGRPHNSFSGEFVSSSLPSEEGGAYRDEGGNQKPSYYKPFPTDNDNRVDKWVAHFSRGKGRESMKRYMERSNRYLELMQSMLRREGLPPDMVYMSMVESGFYPYATSPAKAVGYWQFIPSTGKLYGLKINRAVDERRDFVLSTQAAIEYLTDLYSTYGDWRLSMAAYNAGPQRVTSAVRKHNSKNYWRLVRKKGLPPETRNYVPKVIAMRRISLNPERYGFYDLDYQPPLDYQLFALRRESSLSHISRQLDIPIEELKSLNPKYKTDRIPLEGRKTHIRVPSYVNI